MLTIYKSFKSSVNPTNDSFCKKLESVQYNAALAITGTIKGTSQVKLYKEVGLELLKLRRKLRFLCTK